MDENREIQKVELRSVASVNAETLIAQAIAKDVPMETMEKLLAMRKELKDEAAMEAFFTDLALFQKVCPKIPKTKVVYEKNSHEVRYRYAPLATIIRAVRRKLFNAGFSYLIKTEQTKESVKAIVELHHREGHVEITEFEVPIDPKAFMNAQQKVAATLTFAKRYAFCNATGIMTSDEDTDANFGEELPGAPPKDPPTMEKRKDKDLSKFSNQELHDSVVEIIGSLPFNEATAKRWLTSAALNLKNGNRGGLESIVLAVRKQAKDLKKAGGKA